jgi:carbonic anhydrase/acetyltransferase-like protein (isoleucine patch superfamily)
MRYAIAAILVLLPWPVRRFMMRRLFGYSFGSGAYVGRSLVTVARLAMGEGSYIGHLSVLKGVDDVIVEKFGRIGNLNWITGESKTSRHFVNDADRKSLLFVGEHAAITHRHLIDCTNAVRIGKYATMAGFRSVVLTHSIDLERNCQASHPIVVGDYCFVGTCCTLLGGSRLPDFSVLGAHSLLNKHHETTNHLYGGVPARAIKPVPPGAKYFTRTVGAVD